VTKAAPARVYQNKRLTWIPAFAGMTKTVNGSAKKYFSILAAKNRRREGKLHLSFTLRVMVNSGKISHGVYLEYSRRVRDVKIISLSCHSEHERGLFPDDRVNDGLKIILYSLARAFASKSLVTYCQKDRVGEKFSGLVGT
jgi:hypothetical protein